MNNLRTNEPTELIKITEQNGKRAVNARDLHCFLENKQKFADWIKSRIEKYDFIEGQDYQKLCFDYKGNLLNIRHHNFMNSDNQYISKIEYALSIDMAKELSMIENNDNGRRARKYFIACERKLQEANVPSYQIEDKIKRAEKWIEEEKQRQIAEEKARVLQEENERKDSIIEGLVSEIPLADMRQRITQIVRKGSAGDIGKGYRLLYSEFNYKFHVNVFTRMNNALYKGSAMDYIEKEMNKLPDLYDLACKLFENTYEDLMESWGKSAKRAEHQRNLSQRQKHLL